MTRSGVVLWSDAYVSPFPSLNRREIIIIIIIIIIICAGNSKDHHSSSDIKLILMNALFHLIVLRTYSSRTQQNISNIQDAILCNEIF
jgi:hypothetical protein